MPTRSTRFLMFSLSAAVHLCLYASLGSVASAGGVRTNSSPSPAIMANVVSMELHEAVVPPVPATATGVGKSAPVAELTSPAQEQQADADAPQDAGPASGNDMEPQAKPQAAALLPVLMPAEPHYFELGELTAEPALEQDIPAGKVLSMPDDIPHRFVMHLLISEQGSIDNIDIENAELPEPVQQLVRDTFLALKFRPGKQGETAVKTQMRIEVSLDDILPAARAVPPTQLQR